MNAFYFGTGKRRLFGIYEPARVATTGGRAAVLCNPWGAEYLHAHRSMRQLALRLSAAGYHTLRFDYFGTGDAAGDMEDADLKGWMADIEYAVRELRDMSSAKSCALVGLRLGATLAAMVAARAHDEIDALVLWDPIVQGSEYVSSLQAAASVPVTGHRDERPVSYGGDLEILGFPLTEAMTREMRTLDLASLVPALPDRTLVIASERSGSHDALRVAMGGRLAFEPVASQAPWIENPSNAGVLPVSILQRITEWLA